MSENIIHLLPTEEITNLTIEIGELVGAISNI